MDRIAAASLCGLTHLWRLKEVQLFGTYTSASLFSPGCCVLLFSVFSWFTEKDVKFCAQSQLIVLFIHMLTNRSRLQVGAGQLFTPDKVF